MGPKNHVVGVNKLSPIDESEERHYSLKVHILANNAIYKGS